MNRRMLHPAAMLALLALLSLSATARAHEIRPATADLSFDRAGGYEVSIELNLEALLAGIGPAHSDTSEAPGAAEYAGFRSLPPSDLRRAFDGFSEQFLGGVMMSAGDTRLQPAVLDVQVPPVGDTGFPRLSRIVLGGTLPPGTTSVTWAWDAEFGPTVIRVPGPNEGDPPVFTELLQNGVASDSIPIAGQVRRNVYEISRDYLVIGFTHILPKGLDHILFVIGLYLLSTRLSTLVWQVTSFTIAHTITLALAMLGIVSLSPSIVEPLIAASIVYIGIENTVTNRLQRWRPAIVFGFGLLHGLGFAGVLTDIGLAPAEFVTGLVAFNVGVELGQLAVIAACFLVAGLWFRHKDWYRSVITNPASVLIAAIGAWWFVERTVLA